MSHIHPIAESRCLPCTLTDLGYVYTAVHVMYSPHIYIAHR